jgi:hypothetical protein
MSFETLNEVPKLEVGQRNGLELTGKGIQMLVLLLVLRCWNVITLRSGGRKLCVRSYLTYRLKLFFLWM